MPGLLTREEEVALSARIHGDDAKDAKKARDELVGCNYGLVIPIARRYRGSGLDMDDLIQEGNTGLIRAAKDYELSRGTRFSTYAAKWIKQAITRALWKHGRMIRMPAHSHQKMLKWKKVEQRMIAAGIDPDPDVIQKEIRASDLEREDALKSHLTRYSESLSDPRSFAAIHGGLATFDGGEVANPVATELVALGLSALKPIYRDVVERRYGLGCYVAATESEIGNEIGCSCSMVNYMVRKSQEIMRKELQSIGA